MIRKLLLSIVVVGFVIFMNSCGNSNSGKSELFSLVINDHNGNPRLEQMFASSEDVQKVEDEKAVTTIAAEGSILVYNYEIDKNESSYNVFYDLEEGGVFSINLDVTFYCGDEDEEVAAKKAEDLYQEFVSYFTSNYGEPNQNENNEYFWQLTSNGENLEIIISNDGSEVPGDGYVSIHILDAN